MSQLYELVLIHQNRLFRECLATALKSEQWRAVSEYDSLDEELVEHLLAGEQKLVAVELRTPRLVACQLRKIRKQNSDMKVIAIFPSCMDEAVFECLQIGVDGCLIEEASLDDLKSAVQTVMNGEKYCSPQIANSMYAALGQLAYNESWQQRLKWTQLSTRESDVLHLIAEGRMTNKQIARKLGLSLYTVKNHVHNILKKLKLPNRHKAAEYALQQYMIE